MPKTPYGFYLDEKLHFHDHINAKILKATKGIGIIKGFWIPFPESPFLTIYKCSTRPYFDYCDIIYDQPNLSFCSKIKHIQYNAALAITGAIKGTSLNCIKNWDLSLWNSEDGCDFAPFLKLKQVVNQNISSIWFQQVNILTTPEV